jgi:hypothetical protein
MILWLLFSLLNICNRPNIVIIISKQITFALYIHTYLFIYLFIYKTVEILINHNAPIIIATFTLITR